MLVGRSDLVKHLQRFAGWGFPNFENYFEVVPGSPLVYHSASDGIGLELGIFDELVPGRRRPSQLDHQGSLTTGREASARVGAALLLTR